MSLSPKPRRRRVTLSDVAARASVSEITVSRVLRKPEIVSQELRERVDSAIRELAYVPNRLASGLASVRTGQIGVVVPSFTNGVFNDYLLALHEVFVPAGFQVNVLNSQYMPGREEKAISAMLGQHPEAIVLPGVDQTPHARRMLEEAGIPVVQTMELTDDPIDINIGLSQRNAAYAAARLLFEMGHGAVGHIAAPLDSRSRTRIDGYLHATQEFGAEPMIVAVDGPSSVRFGRELFDRMISLWPTVTALFCGNDNLALGALFECQRRGIAVPGDLSIVGFNDLELSECAYPALSTVATPRYEMARSAAEIILEIIRGSGRRPENRRIDMGFRIIERESTAPPRRSSLAAG